MSHRLSLSWLVRASRGPKDDRRDAFRLANQLRVGGIGVYKERGRSRG